MLPVVIDQSLMEDTAGWTGQLPPHALHSQANWSRVDMVPNATFHSPQSLDVWAGNITPKLTFFQYKLGTGYQYQKAGFLA